MSGVVVLLIVIALLLCVPQQERTAALNSVGAFCLVCFVLYSIWQVGFFTLGLIALNAQGMSSGDVLLFVLLISLVAMAVIAAWPSTRPTTPEQRAKILQRIAKRVEQQKSWYRA